jgi:hypothetical protein
MYTHTSMTNIIIIQKRPAFQGRCHSCNISSTPEWRRGPDGARTLCNACGLRKLYMIKFGKEFFIYFKFLILLDYAKLARKQQENRGMSNSTLLRRSSNNSSSSSPPLADDIILDRSPTG